MALIVVKANADAWAYVS